MKNEKYLFLSAKKQHFDTFFRKKKEVNYFYNDMTS